MRGGGEKRKKKKKRKSSSCGETADEVYHFPNWLEMIV